jgi:hypothetical protein
MDASMQKELLEACQQTSRHWVDRMQSEMALWTGLGSKLVSTRSAPEAFDAYAKCVSQQMKMTAEDGQHLVSDCQQVIQRLTNGWWPKGST